MSAVIFSVSSRRPSRSDINVRDCSRLVSVAAVTCASSNLRRTYSSSEADVAVATDADADADAEGCLFVDDDIISYVVVATTLGGTLIANGWRSRDRERTSIQGY